MGARNHYEAYTRVSVEAPPGKYYHRNKNGLIEPTPSASGMSLWFGKVVLTYPRSERYDPRNVQLLREGVGLRIPLIRSSDMVEGAEAVQTDLRVAEVVERNMKRISAELRSNKPNVIFCRAGRVWGVRPLQEIARHLRDEDYKVNPMFYQVGGMNLVQEHALEVLWNPNEHRVWERIQSDVVATRRSVLLEEE